MIKVEIACNSYSSCLHAVTGGAQRVELFENLAEGGCTPSAGTIKAAIHLYLPVYVMIRPRGGNFVYSNAEINIMEEDIAFCKSVGVKGIVFGCLTASGEVDKTLCYELLKVWNHGPATFHRAIDRSADVLKAAKDIADLGFERILSSGGAPNVMDGIDNLKQMNESVGSKIIIMPGGGVTNQNARQILNATGCREIHATCKHTIASEQGSRNNGFHDTETVSEREMIRSLVANAFGV